jgi:hypothetical protein
MDDKEYRAGLNPVNIPVSVDDELELCRQMRVYAPPEGVVFITAKAPLNVYGDETNYRPFPDAAVNPPEVKIKSPEEIQADLAECGEFLNRLPPLNHPQQGLDEEVHFVTIAKHDATEPILFIRGNQRFRTQACDGECYKGLYSHPLAMLDYSLAYELPKESE